MPLRSDCTGPSARLPLTKLQLASLFPSIGFDFLGLCFLFLSFNFVRFACPFSQVCHFTPVRTKRSKRVIFPSRLLFANRTFCTHYPIIKQPCECFKGRRPDFH